MIYKKEKPYSCMTDLEKYDYWQRQRPPYPQGDWRNETIEGKCYHEREQAGIPQPTRSDKDWWDGPEGQRIRQERQELTNELNRQIEETGTCESPPYDKTLESLRKQQEAKRQREAEEGINDE